MINSGALSTQVVDKVRRRTQQDTLATVAEGDPLYEVRGLARHGVEQLRVSATALSAPGGSRSGFSSTPPQSPTAAPSGT